MNDEGNEQPASEDYKSPPIFPAELIPSSIKRTQRREFFDSEMQSDEDVEHLLELLYCQPDIKTFTFHPKGSPMNNRLLSAEQQGMLQVLETQSFWYEHPKYPNNFVRVSNPDPPFDWQRELRANGQMLFRNELALTTQERRRREIQETAQAVAAATPKPSPPTTLWERIEHHYQRRPALYYLIGIVIAVAGIALAL